MPNNISVSISVDTADLQVKRAIMSAELKAATKDLNDFARQAASSGSTEGLRAGMLASAEAAEKARAGIAKVNTELKGMGAAAVPAAEHVEHGFAIVAEKAREMAAQVRESFESITAMREAAIGFGEVMMAAFAVERIAEWGKEFAEQAEKVKHLGQEFGMTTQQVQGLAVEAKLTGISIDTITKGMGILDKNLFSGGAKASLFKQLGIDAKTAKDQVDLLAAVADKFKDMDDGPKKAALAMQLFGRAGKEMIPILDQGGEAIRAAKEKAQEYDAAYTDLSASAQTKGAALAESINETGVAWMGVTNVLGDAFGPILKEVTDSINSLIKSFIDSYREGGTVAVVFEAIKAVIEAVGAVVDLFVGVFSEMWSAVTEIVGELASVIGDLFGVHIPANMHIGEGAINIFKDTMVVLKDVIIIVCEVIRGGILMVVDYVRMFAKVAHDALTMNWDKIDGDWKAGTDRMAADVENAAKRIQVAMAEAGAAISAALKGEGPPTKKVGIEAGGGAGGDFNPKMGGGGHHKKPKDDLVQRLEAELNAKKLAWAEEQDQRGTAIAYSLAEEADYWKKILDGTNLSAKDRGPIEAKYLAVHGQIVKERIAIVIDGYKQEMAEADKNATAKLAIAQRELEYIGRMYGTESKEYAAAQAEIVKIKRQATEQIEKLDEIRAQKTDKIGLDAIATEEALAKHRVAMGIETNAQLLAQEQAFENRKFAIEQAAAQRARAIVNPKDDPVRAAQLDAQLEQLERQHQAKLTQIDQQAVLQRTAIERAGINSVASSWSQALGKMLTLQQGFGATIKSMWQGLQQAIGNALATILEQWLVKHISTLLLGRAASSAAGAAQVASAAGIAGANGVASWAAAPWPIDAGAPGFGAAMAASAAAFAPAASAAGGYWEIPNDQVVRTHAKEMILPAWAAQGVRSMISGGAANNNAPLAANRAGDTHNHYENHFHGPSDKRGIEQWFMEHHAGVGKAAAKAFRNGAPVPK